MGIIIIVVAAAVALFILSIAVADLYLFLTSATAAVNPLMAPAIWCVIIINIAGTTRESPSSCRDASFLIGKQALTELFVVVRQHTLCGYQRLEGKALRQGCSAR